MSVALNPVRPTARTSWRTPVACRFPAAVVEDRRLFREPGERRGKLVRPALSYRGPAAIKFLGPTTLGEFGRSPCMGVSTSG
jgi:hypothetical protein